MNQRVVKLSDCPSAEARDYAYSLAEMVDPGLAYLTIENYNKWWAKYGHMQGLGDLAYITLKPFVGTINLVTDAITGKKIIDPNCAGCDRRRRWLNGEN